MRIIYADTGLASEMGHHAHCCRIITRAFRDQGHSVTVASWAGLEAPLVSELGARAVFRRYTYRKSDGDPICGWLSAYFDVAQDTAQDFGVLGPFVGNDLLYVNSVWPAQLRAVLIFLAGLPDTARPQTVVELGTDPGLEYVAGGAGGAVKFVARDPRTDARATLYRLTGRLLQSLHLPQLHLVTFDSTSSSVYAELLGTAVDTLPVPHLACPPVRQRGGHGPRTVSIIGDQRVDKGYHLVPEIARLLLASRGDVRLFVHNAQPQTMGEVQRAMHELAAADPRIELKECPVGPEIWQELLARSDVMLCPYVTDRYRGGHSGIAFEAVACAIPLVVPAYTTLERLVQDFQAGGVSFERPEPALVVAALQQVLGDFDTHASRAFAAAARWVDTMGANRTVETMLTRLTSAAI